jgi:integrase
VNFKARRFFERLLHLLILILLDTGCRIAEATGLKVSDVDMDNLLWVLKNSEIAAACCSWVKVRGVVVCLSKFCGQILRRASRESLGLPPAWKRNCLKLSRRQRRH